MEAKKHRAEQTFGMTLYGKIAPDDRAGFVVTGNREVYYWASKSRQSFSSLDEAWDWLETWRLMNGMNEDGTQA